MDTTKQLFTIRHSFKLKTGDKNKWINSKRYKENSLDTPLHPNGLLNASLIGIELLSLHNNNIINLFDLIYIYSSPFTRCCQTAIEIIKIIKKVLNHDIKLRLNSKLWEGANLHKYFIFNDDIAYSKKLNSVIIDGKLYTSELDKKMSFKNLCKKYKKYIDSTYNKVKHIGIEKTEVSATRIIKCVNNLLKKEKLLICVGHANLGYNCYNYYLNNKYPEKVKYLFNDDYKDTSKLTGYEITINDKTKNVKSELLYYPNNDFIIPNFNV